MSASPSFIMILSTFITPSTGITISINGLRSLVFIAFLKTRLSPAVTIASLLILYLVTFPLASRTGSIVRSLRMKLSYCSAKLTSYMTSNTCVLELTIVPLLITGRYSLAYVSFATGTWHVKRTSAIAPLGPGIFTPLFLAIFITEFGSCALSIFVSWYTRSM